MRSASVAALSFLSSLFFALESSAVQLTIQRPPPKAASSSDANNNLINTNNQRYSTNITIAGKTVNVLIDTGSTDLWVAPPGGVPAFNDTGLSTTIRYGTGANFVTGDIGVNEFQLDGQHTIPAQAFLSVTSSAGEESDFAAGHFGIWGLGFNTAGSSQVNDAVQQAKGATSTAGQSVLANIFAQNPSGSDYIGISLSRTGDQEGTSDASLTISEYDTDYAAVANAPKVPQTPANSGAWTVPLDSFSVGGKKIQWPTTLPTIAPTGKNIVLLDTGTTNILMPKAQIDAIYSAIPGAVLAPSAQNIPLVQFSTTTDVWVVPCTAQVDIVATFGGQDFPLHPLDVTDMQVLTSPDGSHNYTVCVGAFTDIGTIAQGETEALFGDSFLRNVYTSFDFGTGGSTKGPPFVQMLSNTDPAKSAADLIDVRRQVMLTMPPELAPVDLVKVFNGTEAPGVATPVALPSAVSIPGGTATPAPAAGGTSTAPARVGSPTTGGGSTASTDTPSTGSGATTGNKNSGTSSAPSTPLLMAVLLVAISSFV
ncbi:aspartic peptidase domain-containing protein [Mycena alexandri]|uniref:Aspartic peptidase domain-containing protein n=1 Tax=Mycena alexandri TaxID=1745969 RepID=A0AAD6X975_9AGAR|nr:aspartic peptidase domain-containing protein [Mycena alexandri]